MWTWIFRRIFSINSLKCRSTALADVVAVPARNFDYDIAGDDGLAAQPGMQCESGSHVESIGHVVVHL